MTKQDIRNSMYRAAELRRLQRESLRLASPWVFAGEWLTVGLVAGGLLMWLLLSI